MPLKNHGKDLRKALIDLFKTSAHKEDREDDEIKDITTLKRNGKRVMLIEFKNGDVELWEERNNPIVKDYRFVIDFLTK